MVFDKTQRLMKGPISQSLEQLEAATRPTFTAVVVAFAKLVRELKAILSLLAHRAGQDLAKAYAVVNAGCGKNLAPASMGPGFGGVDACLVLKTEHDAPP